LSILSIKISKGLLHLRKYEELLSRNEHLMIKETNNLPYNLSGLTLDHYIFINSNHSKSKQLETLAEEIAHTQITYGDIRNQNNLLNRKYELKARRLSYEILMPLSEIIEAYKQGVQNMYELADFFEVSEGFVQQCIRHYKCKYGLEVKYKDYLIKFEPFRVCE
ncbi:ImmA/IrrE family metallo-endopeptidase, partial [Staphylococcus sp. HMSC62D11]